MIPPTAMDSMNFHPKDDEEITVTGVRIKEGFEVYTALLNDSLYTFRTETGKPIWKGLSTWSANKQKCIGCRLCYLNCPANAIQMVNVNGAFKSQIDQTLCTGCNTCVAGTLTKFAGCPVKAISH
jgi:ferredoxin